MISYNTMGVELSMKLNTIRLQIHACDNVGYVILQISLEIIYTNFICLPTILAA